MKSTAPLDTLMEQASFALARGDYGSCEGSCMTALVHARRAGNWADYGRILLPLQECRRQRRLIAAEGHIRLGTDRGPRHPGRWFERHRAGCVVVTAPFTADDVALWQRMAWALGRPVEFLLAQRTPRAATWTLRSFDGPEVSCQVAAPERGWRDRWLTPPLAADASGRTAADWFLDASEALGNAALATVSPRWQPARRLRALEECLRVVRDHELIHQALWAVARDLAAGK